MKKFIIILLLTTFLIASLGCKEQRDETSKEEYPGQEMPKGVDIP
jgi:hypothetical protein